MTNFESDHFGALLDKEGVSHLETDLLEELHVEIGRCLICKRIEIGCLYRELRELGIGPASARSVLRVLLRVYFRDITFFEGKSRATIAAAVTYATCAYLFFNDRLEFDGLPSQTVVADKFGMNVHRGHFKGLGGFPENVKSVYHRLITEHGDLFRQTMGGDWPKWSRPGAFDSFIRLKKKIQRSGEQAEWSKLG